MSMQDKLLSELEVVRINMKAGRTQPDDYRIIVDTLRYLVANTPPTTKPATASEQTSPPSVSMARSVELRYLTERYRQGGGDARFAKPHE